MLSKTDWAEPPTCTLVTPCEERVKWACQLQLDEVLLISTEPTTSNLGKRSANAVETLQTEHAEGPWAS